MRNLHDLIDDIRRAGKGEPTSRRSEPDVRPEDFDLALDVEIEPEAPPEEDEAAREDLWVDLEQVAQPGSEPAGDPDPDPEPRPKPPAPRRRLPRPRLRTVLAGVLAVGLAVGAWVAYDLLVEDRAAPVPDVAAPGAAGEQAVATWTVSDPADPEATFLTVVTAGGPKAPIALGIPGYTVTYTPGLGSGALADALAARDPELVARAAENLLGVRVDAWGQTDLRGLASIVDAVGGIEVGDRRSSGEEAVAYLLKGGSGAISAEFQFLRWQEVSKAVLDAVDGRVDALEPLGEDLARVLAAAGAGGAEVLELPVVDIGSGLARPDVEATAQLVDRWFVPTAQTTKEVRLVVMNGVGTPGVAERVSRILVPSGFELVSSLNADTFDVKETRIVAANRSFLPEARLARELLGAGKVYIDRHPTNLADVTVIVGADFGGS